MSLQPAQPVCLQEAMMTKLLTCEPFQKAKCLGPNGGLDTIVLVLPGNANHFCIFVSELSPLEGPSPG